MPSCLPPLTRACAKWLRREQHDGRRSQEHAGHGETADAPRELADVPGHADQVGLAALPLRRAPQVEAEECEQAGRIIERQPPRERDDQRIETGRAEEDQLCPAAGMQLDAAGWLAATPGAPGKEHRHERPPEAEQEPVAARHVRRGIVRILRHVSGAPGEVEIDGVLGQYRNDGEDGRRQAAGDVVARGLRRPDQEEGGGDDRRPEDEHRRHGGQMDAAEPQHHRRGRNGSGEGDLEPCPHPALLLAGSRCRLAREPRPVPARGLTDRAGGRVLLRRRASCPT